MQFAEIEPIRFGKIEAMPERLTTETRLRVGALKFGTDAEISEAISVLSSVFGTQAAEVKIFMEKNMYPYDFQKLQAYLLGGMESVHNIERAMRSAMVEAIKERKDETA